MSPHYDRHAGVSSPTIAPSELDDDAMVVAAEALRQVEVEAVQPDTVANDSNRLEYMSIDELRKLAAALDVPDRGAITDKSQLIAAIRQRL